MHVIAAKAVCFEEALKPEFRTYAKNICDNAQALANGLMDRGVKIVSGGTDNHLMLMDLTPQDKTGKEIEKQLDQAHITANKNAIPCDPEKPTVTSGLRVGTPAVTTRGFGKEEMREVGELIALTVYDFAAKKEEIAARVAAVCKKFPLYE